MSTAHISSLLGIAFTAAFSSLFIGLPRIANESISWMPVIQPGEGILVTVGIFILGIASAARGPSWGGLSLRQLAYSALPFLAYSLLKQDQRPQPKPISSCVKIVDHPGAGNRNIDFTFRKSFLWRRVEAGLTPIFIQSAAVPLLFIVLGCGLANHPPGSTAYLLSYWLQGYAMVASMIACLRYELNTTRGKLSSRWRFPLWPLTMLPVLNVIIVLLLMERETPTGHLVTSLFFDRRTAPRYRWESLRSQLPRLRRSSLQSTGEVLQVESFLRAQTALLCLQLSAIGIYRPLPFSSVLVDFLAIMAGTFMTVTGWLLKNLHPTDKTTRPKVRQVVFSWLLLSSGSPILGLLIGSAVGRSQMQLASMELFIFPLLGCVVSGLLMVISSSRLQSKFHDGIWYPVMMALATLGGLATQNAQFEASLERIILWGGIMAWVLYLPINLSYQGLFLAPFTIRDLWRRGQPRAIRRHLLPTILALVLPLGGLANALLALNAQKRDERLRLWWQTRRSEHSLASRVCNETSTGVGR